MKTGQAWRLLAEELSCKENPLLEAELILRHLKGWTKEKFYASLEEELEPQLFKKALELVQKRKQGYPLQYITGWVEFFSRRFRIEEGVFIPRPETEVLVEEALKILKPGWKVVDVGTGSGIIAITLAAEVENIKVFATDISERALMVAQDNARLHRVEGKIEFIKTPFMNRLLERGEKVNMVVSNPPYVDPQQKSSLPPELSYEPPEALFSEEGIKHTEKIISQAEQILLNGGWLLIETSPLTCPALKSLYPQARIVKDRAGMERVFILRL